MSDGRTDNGFDEELPVFMDLVSHDILNINQTVLSAIELMMTSTQADDRAKRHARRAESQLRISTQIFESVKVLCVTRKTGKMLSEPVDLRAITSKVTSNVPNMFPDRRVRIDVEGEGDEAFVKGGGLVQHVLLNALVGVFQLDISDEAVIRLRVSREAEGESPGWVVHMVDEEVEVPEALDFETMGTVSDDSRSRMVRVAGLVLARVMVEKLGGTFQTAQLDRGSEFRIKFTEAV